MDHPGTIPKHLLPGFPGVLEGPKGVTNRRRLYHRPGSSFRHPAADTASDLKEAARSFR
jgi:hypothetical protein